MDINLYTYMYACMCSTQACQVTRIVCVTHTFGLFHMLTCRAQDLMHVVKSTRPCSKIVLPLLQRYGLLMSFSVLLSYFILNNKNINGSRSNTVVIAIMVGSSL